MESNNKSIVAQHSACIIYKTTPASQKDYMRCLVARAPIARELKFLSQPFPEQAAVPNFFIVVLILAIWRHDARGVVCHHQQ